MRIRLSSPPAVWLFAALLSALPAAAQQGSVVVRPVHLDALSLRLDSLAAGLPPAERALWDVLLRRAASAPTPRAEVQVCPVLEAGPGGGCDGGAGGDPAARVGIIVEGGRGAPGSAGIVVQGGRQAGPGGGIIVQGGRAPAPGRVLAPRAEGPRPAPVGTVAIGPKQDDPSPPPQALGRRIAELSSRLPDEERGALEWLLTRAAEAPEGGRPAGAPGRPGTPGGPQPAAAVSLRQALGIDPLAIGPKQDDPTPPPPARWILRY